MFQLQVPNWSLLFWLSPTINNQSTAHRPCDSESTATTGSRQKALFSGGQCLPACWGTETPFPPRLPVVLAGRASTGGPPRSFFLLSSFHFSPPYCHILFVRIILLVLSLINQSELVRPYGLWLDF